MPETAGAKYFAGKDAFVRGVLPLDYAKAGIRINAVCPGIIDIGMTDRFTGGTDEGRKRVTAQEPIGQMGEPEEIAAGSAPTPPPSS
jgi:NAD(P)-dependent dehydrogenase (short-subunit alcohol dehydrogenase family)